MKLIDAMKTLLSAYCGIVTGSLFAAAVFCSIFYHGESLRYEILWQILIVAALCTLSTLILLSSKELSKKQMLFRQILQFVVLLVILLICAYAYGWIARGSLIQPLVFLLLVTGVYVIVKLLLFSREKQAAKLLNKRLKSLQDEEE